MGNTSPHNQGKKISIEIIDKIKLHRLVLIIVKQEGAESFPNEFNIRKFLSNSNDLHYFFPIFHLNHVIFDDNLNLKGQLPSLELLILRIESFNFPCDVQLPTLPIFFQFLF